MRTSKFNTLTFIAIGFFISFVPLVMSSISNGGNLIDGWTPIIIGCITFGLYMAMVNAEYDKDKRIKGFHYSRFAVRSFAILCYVFLAIRFNHNAMYLPLATIVAASFGIVFDPLRNHLAGQSFFYTGTEAAYDNITHKNPIVAFVIEIVVLIGSVILAYYVGQK